MSEIRTVTGPIHPDELGFTLMHEHILVDASVYRPILEPTIPEKYRGLWDAPLTMDKLALLHKMPILLRENVALDDEEHMAGELADYRETGGAAILDVTAAGLRVDVQGVKRLSERTGVHIVTSTGFYIEPSWPDHVRDWTVDQFAHHMIGEIQDGIEGTDVRAGHIKVGITDLSERQERVLVAAARAAQETGASVTVHPGFTLGCDGRWIADILIRAGLPPERLIIAHTESHLVPGAMRDLIFTPDLPLVSLDFHRALLDRGVNISLDTFGSLWDVESMGILLCPDWLRVRALVQLLEEGYGGQIVLGHDVFMKIMTRAYGGNGYSHLARHVIPQLRELGVGDYEIRRMTVTNPARLLTLHT